MTVRWVIIFALLSLLAHVVIITAILLVTRFMPVPKINVPPPTNPSVSLSLIPPPQPKVLQPKPPQPSLFLPSNPDANAKPNQDTPIESDNDNRLKSENKQARKSDAPLPDVTGQKNHALDLQNTPLVQATQKPEASTTPPIPKQNPSKQPPTPPQPKRQMTQTQKSTPQPTKPTAKPPDTKPPPPQVAKNTVDPTTGLPVLPPIDAPTLAPQTQVDPTQQAQTSTPAHPPPSFQVNKSDIAGAAGAPGVNSAATKATELGRYKAKVYRAVGSRWYDKVGQQLQVLPVGLVRVQFTIYSDGSVTTMVLDGGNSTMQTLLSISINSIREAAPFDAFTDSMRQELIKEQGGDGNSYTDDFTFSVY